MARVRFTGNAVRRMGKNKNTKTYKLQLLKLLHIAVSVTVFFVFWLLFRYGSLRGMNPLRFRYNIFVMVGYGLMLYWLHRTYNSYLLGFSKIRSLVLAQLISQVFSLAMTYVIVSVAWMRFDPPWIFLPLLVAQCILDIFWSWGATRYFFRVTPVKRTIFLYRNEVDRLRLGMAPVKNATRLYRIEREIRFDGSFSSIEDELSAYDAVFVSGLNIECRNELLKYCKQNGIVVFVLPQIGDMIMREGVHIKTFDTPFLYVSRKTLEPGYAIFKRIFDIVFSGVTLLLMSPLMLVTALAIRLCDHGPVFYRQTRLTKDGKQFRILKFRSMRVDAEKDGVARLSTGLHDDRITPVGRIIRKCRIDELPQLLNILKGDMSVVGPRPERPEIAAAYCEQMPEFQLRLQVKAGLTGYAQVYGKYNTGPYEKLAFDLLYIQQMKILTDLQLCFATFSILFAPDSTQGVDEGSVTALDSLPGAEPLPTGKTEEGKEVRAG